MQDKMSEPAFWQDADRARTVAQRLDSLKKHLDFWEGLGKRVADLEELIILTENDKKLEAEVTEQIQKLETEFSAIEMRTLFTGKYDGLDAIVSIHAGAGGTDAQDWAEILLRMYLRYCEKQNWKTDVLSISKGNEAGIKSVVLEVKGEYAYGFLKNEAGVHRLVRISPFNTGQTRETSFALLEVLPEIKEVETVLDPKDLKIETSTASGHGGQSVNTTYSAVRITHIPTNITVSIQNERSQHQNKEKALEILQSKLAKLEEDKRQKEKKEIRGEFHSPEWGNQIRSYVLHPYKMVKDHRTDYETSNVDDVLNGNINDFIEKNLQRSL